MSEGGCVQLVEMAKQEHDCPSCTHWVAMPGFEMFEVRLGNRLLWHIGQPGRSVPIDQSEWGKVTMSFRPKTSQSGRPEKGTP